MYRKVYIISKKNIGKEIKTMNKVLRGHHKINKISQYHKNKINYFIMLN